MADAHATTLFVLGQVGLSWVARHAGYDAYVIDHEEVATWTPGFAAYR